MSAQLYISTARGRAFLNRPGFVPGLTGALLLAQLFVLRAVASADLNSVTFAGHALHWDCWFRQRFSIPCPTCGMTRSFLLTLQGQFNQAVQLNPAGPLLVLGLCILGGALLSIMLCAQTQKGEAIAARLRQHLRFGATVYAGLFIAILLAHWVGDIWPR